MEQTLTSAFLAALTALFTLSAEAETQFEYPELVNLYYDFEVTGYCSLVTDRVGRGFKREQARLVSLYGIDQPTVQRLRGEGWQAAHKEWQNRGLGGFKGWCRTEGAAAAARFSLSQGP